jgi:protein-S-isoprenylcysteine O-methyltransferase Ste14
VTRALVLHALLLAAPVVAAGRGAELARPEAIAIVVLLLSFSVVESRARGVEAMRFGAPGTWLALASAIALLVTAWLALATPLVWRWTWLGAPMIALGIALRVTAIRALGHSFSSETVIVPGRKIVTGGIHARLRHPSEIGLVLAAAGVAILGASAAAACVVVGVVVPASIARVRAENAALAAAARRC